MATTHNCPILHQAKKACLLQLHKFLQVEESILKQKARVQWLKLGDSNTHFFFHAMKERYLQDSIEILHDENGAKLITTNDIQQKVMRFYKGLMGTTALQLPSVDVAMLRAGIQVSSTDATALIQPITSHEIEAALWSIDEVKAPGIDGFNILFFKKAWPIIKTEVCAAVSQFFETCIMLPAINCTLITLFPKVANPTLIKDYRPIACCTILYKIIAKILTNRMYCMISSVIDLAQSGFIPGRNIYQTISF